MNLTLHQPDITRKSVLAVIGADTPEGRKLTSCRFRSGCNSLICPHCCQRVGLQRGKSLMLSALQMPESKLSFPTFNGPTAPLDSLRTVTQEVMRSARRSMANLKIKDFAIRPEVAIENENYRLHVHALTASPATGRGYISSAQWADAWLTELPADLHPIERSAVHVESVLRDLGDVTNYITKSPFAKKTVDQVKRVIDSIFATSGLHLFERGGRFQIDLRTGEFSSVLLCA